MMLYLAPKIMDDFHYRCCI